MDSLSLTDSLPDVKPAIFLDSSSVTLHDQLPTPPFSPPGQSFALTHPQPDPISVANELIAHYQKESIWAHHTRASLELALTADGCDSFTAARAKHRPQSPQLKTEPDPASPPRLQKRDSRWMRRKQSFNLNLKLDGVPNSAAAVLAKRRRRDSHRSRAVPEPEASTMLLEMFSELVEARMESCLRLSALAQAVYAPQLDACP